jgi:hypothetical protein
MPRNGHQNGAFRGRAPSGPPPGGTAALAQQTPATQLLTVVAGGFRAPTRYSSRRPRVRSQPRRRRKLRLRKTSKRGGRKSRAYLVRGSAAAKRHMAKLRRMQKRRK